MFEIQSEGRLVRVKPTMTMWNEEDGWLVMDRVAAQSLADKINASRSWQEDETEDEDG